MVFTDEFKNSYQRIGTNQFFNAWTKWNRESHSFRKYLLQTKKNLQLYSIQKYFTRARPNSCFKRWKSTRNPWSFFLIMFRSSHGRCSVGKVALKDFAKFTGKHLFQGLLFFLNCSSRASNFIKKESLTQMFFCEFYGIYKNTIFTKQRWATILSLQLYKQGLHVLCFLLTSAKFLKTAILQNTCMVTHHRGRHWRCSFKKSALKKFHNIHRKTPTPDLFNKVGGLKACNFLQRESNAGVFL